MYKKFYGLIILLFGLSTLCIELFLINIIQYQIKMDVSVYDLLFTVFPMNFGFFIPIILIIIGLLIIKKRTK